MGIGILWDQIGEGEVTNIAEYASEHYAKTGRPLRIAVDAACWIYNNVTKAQTEQIRESSDRPSNPMEKAILHRILRFLFLGIQLHFVFDGPKRPPKRGIVWRSTHDKSTDLLVKTLNMLGISWHKAYAEAEADCAELQKRGIVDAVWTEDGDAFMFGCTTLIRFHYEKKQGKDSKSNTHVRVYQANDILKRLPGLDREGFVLYVILNGGDYDKGGLRGFGMSNSLEAVKAGLGKSLCRAAESDLPRWREELVQYLKDLGSKIVVPATFPVWEHLRDYREPLITQSLSSKWQQARPILEAELKLFVQEYYNFQAEKWVDWIVPMLLVRTLMQTGPGQERSNAGYEIKIGKQSNTPTIKATFLLSAATSLDMAQYSKMKEGNFYENDFRASCETLPWILKRGVPDTAEAYVIDISAKSSTSKKPKASKGTKTAQARPGKLGKASSDTGPPGTGKKRGRPRKDDKTPSISAIGKVERSRKLAALDSNRQSESSEKSAKRAKLSPDLKSPALINSSKFAKSSPANSAIRSLQMQKSSLVSKPSAVHQREIIDLFQAGDQLTKKQYPTCAIPQRSRRSRVQSNPQPSLSGISTTISETRISPLNATPQRFACSMLGSPPLREDSSARRRRAGHTNDLGFA
ncbi:PIN domain-like protein [Hyaloscypha variabilis]